MRLRRLTWREAAKLDSGPPVGVPVTLRENALRKAFLLLLLTLLATGSIAKLSSGDHGFENWVGAILAPPAALLLGYVTLRGPRTLHLDERGFVASSGLPWRPPLDVAWRDVDAFTTERPGDGPASVWYQLRPAASRLPRRYRWMRRLIETPDNGLPTTYGGMSAVELGAYLERWREHATSQGAPSAGRAQRDGPSSSVAIAAPGAAEREPSTAPRLGSEPRRNV